MRWQLQILENVIIGVGRLIEQLVILKAEQLLNSKSVKSNETTQKIKH